VNDVPQAMRLFVGEPVWTPLNRPQVLMSFAMFPLSAVSGIGADVLDTQVVLGQNLDHARIWDMHSYLHGRAKKFLNSCFTGGAPFTGEVCPRLHQSHGEPERGGGSLINS